MGIAFSRADFLYGALTKGSKELIMKYVLKIFILSILASQFALAGRQDSLKQAIDEFHYSLTVEWDQKDQAFRELQEEILMNKITAFVQSGATRDELEQAFYQATKLELTDIENELFIKKIQSPTEIRDFLKLRIEQTYYQGVSWDAQEFAAGLIAASVILGAFLLGSANYE